MEVVRGWSIDIRLAALLLLLLSPLWGAKLLGLAWWLVTGGGDGLIA